MDKNIKLIVFDLDGTLLNTREDICNSMNYALAYYGLPERALDEYNHIVGGGTLTAAYRSCPENTPDEEVEKVFNLYKTHYSAHCLDKSYVYEGINTLLYRLRIMGMILGVLTNKTDTEAKKILDHYFPNKPFAAVLGNRGDIPIKPRPDMGIWLCRTLNISASSGLYLGDSDTDVLFAKAVGFVPVGAGWGFRGREELIYAGAKAVLDNPKELLDLLR